MQEALLDQHDKLQGTEPGIAQGLAGEDLTFSSSGTQMPGALALPGIRVGNKGTNK